MNTFTEKNHSNRYRLYYLLALSAICCYDSYMSVYLEQYLHMTGVQIGIFLSLTIICGLVFMPVCGKLGDSTGKYREILMLCTAGTIIFSFLLSLQTGFFLTLLMGIGFELNRCPLLSMADTNTLNYCTLAKRNYGSIRNFGCAGWTVGSLCCAYLVKKYTLGEMFFRFFIGTMAAALILQFFLPRIRKQDIFGEAGEQSRPKKEQGGFLLLLSNKRFLFLLGFVLLTGALNEGINSYISLHMVSTLHCEEYVVSIYSVITPLPEFIFLLYMNKYILPKTGYRGLYLICAGATAIRMFLYAVIPGLPLFLLAGAFNFLTTACQTGLNIQFLRTIVPKKLMGSAAALFNACFMGSRAIWSLLFGFVYEAAGTRTIFVLCGILSTLGLISLLLYRSFGREDLLI